MCSSDTMGQMGVKVIDCFQNVSKWSKCWFYIFYRAAREDTVIPHYLLMTDNLWHHGYTGEPLWNTLIRDMHKTHAQFAFTFVWLLVALFVTSRFFSSAIFGLSPSHSDSVWNIPPQVSPDTFWWLRVAGFGVVWLQSVMASKRSPT